MKAVPIGEVHTSSEALAARERQVSFPVQAQQSWLWQIWWNTALTRRDFAPDPDASSTPTARGTRKTPGRTAYGNTIDPRFARHPHRQAPSQTILGADTDQAHLSR